MIVTLLAVDGNSLAHRAYYALRGENLGGAWVAHGMVRMLATAWSYGPFDAVLIAFDGADNLRKRRWPAYKANRDEKQPDLVEQLDRAATVLADSGFAVRQQRGYEADDLLAAAAGEAAAARAGCWVLSSDRDLLALVTDQVRVLRPRSSITDCAVYDRSAVEREFGVRPEQYVDLAALRGDPSDGLTGAHGVGAKTAARLVRSYGSVEALYAGVGDLPAALARALMAARDDVERNLELMTPLVPEPLGVGSLLAAGLDHAGLVNGLEQLGLSAAAVSLRLAFERPSPPPLPPPPDEEPPGGTRRTRPPAGAIVGEQVSLFA